MSEPLTPEEKEARIAKLVDALSDQCNRLLDRNAELLALLEESCEAICEQQLELTRHRLGQRFTKKYAGLAAKISLHLAADGEGLSTN